jgi:hypothetical protein
MVFMNILGRSVLKYGGVTILKPEKDNFRGEFYRNRNRKGFKDTKINSGRAESPFSNKPCQLSPPANGFVAYC